MKNIVYFLVLGLLIIPILIQFVSCKKDIDKENTPQVPSVVTTPISNITQTTAISGGNVISEGSSSVATRGICWSTSIDPTTADNVTINGSGLGSYISQIKGLSPGIAYYVRAYAINSAGTSYGQMESCTTSNEDPNQPCAGILSVTYGGEIYNTLPIGNQCWMDRNLNIGIMVNSLSTGISHSDVSNNGIIEKYCYNNDAANCTIYGGLYDWNEMMEYVTVPGTQGICPVGWHIPTDAEWCTLTTYLDPIVDCNIWGFSGNNISDLMRATGNDYWNSNSSANNLSGFTALGAGMRRDYGNFDFRKNRAYFWSSTEYSFTDGVIRFLEADSHPIGRSHLGKTHGYSVRCLRDK